MCGQMHTCAVRCPPPARAGEGGSRRASGTGRARLVENETPAQCTEGFYARDHLTHAGTDSEDKHAPPDPRCGYTYEHWQRPLRRDCDSSRWAGRVDVEVAVQAARGLRSVRLPPATGTRDRRCPSAATTAAQTHRAGALPLSAAAERASEGEGEREEEKQSVKENLKLQLRPC